MTDFDLYFSEHFGVDPAVLEEYGAFDVSIVSDLPLFIDPFLLFNSDKPEYQALHEQILKYLYFLRDKAAPDLDPALIKSWYRFKEVKQNWLGFTVLGNGGSGLGGKFATSLHKSLGSILTNFGSEQITVSSHLEKLALIQPGVGRDNISDFATNLIKDYLLEYTQTFAKTHLAPEKVDTFAVTRAAFNYDTESWETRRYILPRLGDDFVLLTPADILTRDDTWISQVDMIRRFDGLPLAVPDDSLRAQVNNYFRQRLGKKPTAKDRAAAAHSTIRQFPELIDYYIKTKEESGDEAVATSSKKVDDTYQVLVNQLRLAVADLASKTEFYDQAWNSYDEALDRVHLFKAYVEDNDGYKLINRAGKPFSREDEVQLFFGLLWCSTDFDVNREPNNGRGSVDFKVSYGAGDKSLIEFKLASNSALKRNLEKQVAIYEKANKTDKSIKVIVCYTQADQEKVATVLKELGLDKEPSIVVIDARNDNKPSASKA
ncbi:hypothetical protein H0B56_08245 [Haloechinothrix sp. YIM 98757]|uniref:Coiled-coil protein n=1 Tax=Haloechinothrix aidingensis TaxID=2752311 RepID=A0A838A885_9PSEU|nr:hypothetical protein [Haloechinothrix aidingensis]MBA0125528.1 hypothetical protein [Haloechinothrix aidingensis]